MVRAPLDLMPLPAQIHTTVLRPPIGGDPTLELRRAAVAVARLYVRRQGSFHGWLQTVLLRRHDLTSCSCGLINCH